LINKIKNTLRMQQKQQHPTHKMTQTKDKMVMMIEVAEEL
jgi:hypothetical protein